MKQSEGDQPVRTLDPDGSAAVGSLPLDGRSGSRRQLDPGRS